MLYKFHVVLKRGYISKGRKPVIATAFYIRKAPNLTVKYGNLLTVWSIFFYYKLEEEEKKTCIRSFVKLANSLTL